AKLVCKIGSRYCGKGIKGHRQSIVQLPLKDASIELGNHNSRNSNITGVAAPSHFDRWTVHIIDHNNAYGSDVLDGANLVGKKASAAIDHCDFSLQFRRF